MKGSLNTILTPGRKSDRRQSGQEYSSRSVISITMYSRKHPHQCLVIDRYDGALVVLFKETRYLMPGGNYLLARMNLFHTVSEAQGR